MKSAQPKTMKILARKRKGSALGLCAFAFLVVTHTHAATTWNNNVTGDWFLDSNWSAGTPASGVDTFINDGTAQITSGTAQSGDTTAGNLADSGSAIGVSGAGTEWDSGFLFLGNNGSATLSVSDSAVVSSSYSYISEGAASDSGATISGSGSQWNTTNVLHVGAGGTGMLTIDSGAVVTADYAYIGDGSGSHGSISVSGANSQFSISPTQTLFIGSGGTGTLSLSGGGKGSAANANLGGVSGASGTLTVVGSGSEWDGGLIAGYSGSGVVNIASGGTVNTPGYTLVLGLQSGSQGTLNIGLESGTTTAGTLNSPNISSSTTGIINFNQTNATSFAPDIAGHVFVNQPGTGVTRISGTNTYTGATAITAGTFLVNGAHTVTSGTSAAYTVNSGATLGGTGTINLSAVNLGVTIGSGGKLSPGDGGAGTLTLSLGDGVLNVSSAIAIGSGEFVFDLADPATSDKISLTSGTLNLGAAGLEFSDFTFNVLAGFADGTYILFDTNSAITGTLGANLTDMISGQFATVGLSLDGQDVTLTVSSVQEPSVVDLEFAGAIILLSAAGVSRRRSRASP